MQEIRSMRRNNWKRKHDLDDLDETVVVQQKDIFGTNSYILVSKLNDLIFRSTQATKPIGILKLITM